MVKLSVAQWVASAVVVSVLLLFFLTSSGPRTRYGGTTSSTTSSSPSHVSGRPIAAPGQLLVDHDHDHHQHGNDDGGEDTPVKNVISDVKKAAYRASLDSLRHRIDALNLVDATDDDESSVDEPSSSSSSSPRPPKKLAPPPPSEPIESVAPSSSSSSVGSDATTTTTNGGGIKGAAGGGESLSWGPEHDQSPLPAPIIVDDPPFCVGNSVCDKSRGERAMYEAHRVRAIKLDAETPKRECTKPVKLYLEPKLHDWWAHILKPAMQAFRDCPVQCEVVHDPGQADVVTSLVHPGHKRRADQAVAIITMESFHGHAGNNIGVSEEQASDFILSYNRKSDVWANYFYGLTGDNWELCKGKDCLVPTWPPAHDAFKKHDALSALFVGNCVKERFDYLGELMKHIKVDSYSNCHHTPGLDAPGSTPGYDKKWTISAEYKFHLAFENIPLDDYVTEKFFQPFKYGNLMVYWGAPNAQDYAPGPHSFINAHDFKGPKELAEYITKVNNNQTLYDSYFAWRDRGMSRRFWSMSDYNFSDQSKNSWMCRLCQKYSTRYCSAPPLNPLAKQS